MNICDGPRSDKQLSSERKYVGIMYSYAYIYAFEDEIYLLVDCFGGRFMEMGKLIINNNE